MPEREGPQQHTGRECLFREFAERALRRKIAGSLSASGEAQFLHLPVQKPVSNDPDGILSLLTARDEGAYPVRKVV